MDFSTFELILLAFSPFIALTVIGTIEDFLR